MLSPSRGRISFMEVTIADPYTLALLVGGLALLWLLYPRRRHDGQNGESQIATGIDRAGSVRSKSDEMAILSEDKEKTENHTGDPGGKTRDEAELIAAKEQEGPASTEVNSGNGHANKEDHHTLAAAVSEDPVNPEVELKDQTTPGLAFENQLVTAVSEEEISPEVVKKEHSSQEFAFDDTVGTNVESEDQINPEVASLDQTSLAFENQLATAASKESIEMARTDRSEDLINLGQRASFELPLENQLATAAPDEVIIPDVSSKAHSSPESDLQNQKLAKAVSEDDILPEVFSKDHSSPDMIENLVSDANIAGPTMAPSQNSTRSNGLEPVEKQTAPYDPLADLAGLTKFSDEEIRQWYEMFIAQNPNGLMAKGGFETLFQQMFPKGDAAHFTDNVFRTYDVNGDGTINFKEFMCGISVTSRGSREEKLEWAFNLYDEDGSGSISMSEVLDVVKSVNQMHGTHNSNPKKLVKKLFKKFDSDHDGTLSKEEFLTGCLNDQTFVELLEWDNPDD